MFRDIFHMYPSEYRAKTERMTPRADYEKHQLCYQNDELLNEKIKEYLMLN